MDVKLLTSKKEQINVEMQVQNDPEIYINRSVYYGEGLIKESLAKGEDYDMMRKSIIISLMKEPLFLKHNRHHSIYLLKEFSENDILTDIFQLHFLELSKINPKEKPIEEMDELERFCIYAFYAGSTSAQGKKWLEEILRAGGEVTKMIHQVLTKVSEEDILRERALAKEKFRLDRQSELGYAVRKGRREGLIEGQNKLNELNRRLAKDHRIEDLIRAAEDQEYQETLLKEYGL